MVYLMTMSLFLGMAGRAYAQGVLPAGCAQSGGVDYSSTGFNTADFDLESVSQDSGSGNLVLDTGATSLDPSNIVIPFEQDVYSVFLLEGAGYRSHLGWFLKSDADARFQTAYGKDTDTYVNDNGSMTWGALTGAGVTLHYLYQDIEDDQETGGCCSGGDGVLDTIKDDENDWDNDGSSTDTLMSGSTGSMTEAGLEAAGYTPESSAISGYVSEDEVDPRDMRKHMGQIQQADGSVLYPKIGAGEEIVYFLLPNGSTGSPWFSKDNWSGDTWNPSNSTKDNATLAFDLGTEAPESGGSTSWVGSTWTQGFLPGPVRDRLGNPDNDAAYPTGGYFGVQMTGTKSFNVNAGQKYNHFFAANPPDDPFKWIIGVEDLSGGGDADFNDAVFMIERKTGGVAELLPAASPSISLAANEYITTVTFGVEDIMPGTSCGGAAGDTYIKYYLSVDEGVNWVEITSWDIIRTPDSAGSDVTDWSYGNPEYTYRETTINFMELGMAGNRLLWKAELVSSNDACVPEVVGVTIDYNAAQHGDFSRSAPVNLGNVAYNAYFETPDAAWTDKTPRGHLKSTRLYDPRFPTAGYSTVDNWEAGAKLGGTDATADPGAPAPSARNVYTLDFASTAVTGEVVGTGDGTTTEFTGTLAGGAPANQIIAYSTVSITGSDTGGTPETFVDVHTSSLDGSLMGTGTINRWTGEFTLTFTNPPAAGSDVTANYAYYIVSGLQAFNSGNVTYDDLGLTESGCVWGSTGCVWQDDFNSDGLHGETTANREADADWLVDWVRGYEDGSAQTTRKEWILGAIDHSAPAIVGAPGLQGWYYGGEITDDERDTFDLFRCLQRTRSTAVHIGARDGQLHTFDAGEFRPYYVDESRLDSGSDKCGGTNGNVTDLTILNKFRGDPDNPSSTGAINPNGAVYPAPDGSTITINRGYYEWPDASGPDYGTGLENWSYIPANLLGKLKNNKLKADDGAFVDASPSVAHVRFASGAWHTVLISAQGNGGDHVFALDVTDPNTPSFLWEFADPDLFRSRSSPSIGSIGRIQTATGAAWAVFFVSGINNDAAEYPSIYVLNVETGELIDRMYLDPVGAGIGGTPSGQPALVDSDSNGFVDRFYIGTDKGFMYKGVIPDNPEVVSGQMKICSPVFFETYGTSGQALPIYASPAVSVNNAIGTTGEIEYRVDVFFGTSSSPFHADTMADQYFFFAVRDSDQKGQCSGGTELWNFALPAGQQVFATAFATAGRVYFGTTTAVSEDPCAETSAAAGGSEGVIYVLESDTGANVLGAGQSVASGNVTTTPLVDDEHLYIKTANGELKAYGGNTFQNETKQGGFSEATVGVWREISY